MQTVITRKKHDLSTSDVRILSLASFGAALEFYDFVIFVFFVTVIGKLFFAASLSDWVRQVHAFGIFAAGYLARPIGGVVMAHFGDTRGRKRMFTLSVLLMAIPTLLIGLPPTYQSIGVAAPLLLLLMRVLQGVAIGGEAPGAWVFAGEHAPRGRAGFAIGLLTSGLSFGVLLGSLMATCLSRVFGQVQIAAGAWRIPFVMGGVFGFIAMWLRRWLKETPVFEEMRNRATLSRELPLGVVLKSHGRAVVTSILSAWMLAAVIVVVIFMTPSLMAILFGITSSQAQAANLVATAVMCISTVVVGASTDRFGVKRTAVPTQLVLIASVYGLYRGAEAMPAALVPLYALAGSGAGAVVLTPITMIHAFPTSIRFSGVSFSYNFSYALFGGLTPLFVSWLAHCDRSGPAHYVAAVTIIGLGATLTAPKHAFNDVDSTAP